MNRPKTLVTFCIFLVCFYAVLAFRFQYFVLDKSQSEKFIIPLGLGLLVASFFLGSVLRLFKPEKSVVRATSEALLVTFLLFSAVSFGEEFISDQQYSSNNRPEKFSQLTGHCGTYAGRTILKILHAEVYDSSDGALKEFKLNQECRLEHLGFIMQNRSAVCEANEDGIECLIRWMGGISEHGYWSRYTRKFFYDQVLKWWPESKKEEALVDYAAKDQELESGRQSILKQAGIEEAFNAKLLLVQEKEELSNLMLTRDIFKTVELSLTDVKNNPPPYLFKFTDLKSEAEIRLAKIPDLEKEVEKLKGSPAQ